VPRLTRDDWIDAALAALAEKGVAGVAIEPLAARLGVTKGSGYHHFRDRDELLAAALERWEEERTGGLVARLDPIADPRERFRAWARYALGADKALLLALHAAASHPVVAPVLTRVTERRIGWLVGVLRDAGVPPATARRRARLLYAADLGLYELAAAVPAQRLSERDRRALISELETAFLSER